MSGAAMGLRPRRPQPCALVSAFTTGHPRSERPRHTLSKHWICHPCRGSRMAPTARQAGCRARSTASPRPGAQHGKPWGWAHRTAGPGPGAPRWRSRRRRAPASRACSTTSTRAPAPPPTPPAPAKRTRSGAIVTSNSGGSGGAGSGAGGRARHGAAALGPASVAGSHSPGARPAGARPECAAAAPSPAGAAAAAARGSHCSRSRWEPSVACSSSSVPGRGSARSGTGPGAPQRDELPARSLAAPALPPAGSAPVAPASRSPWPGPAAAAPWCPSVTSTAAADGVPGAPRGPPASSPPGAPGQERGEPGALPVAASPAAVRAAASVCDGGEPSSPASGCEHGSAAADDAAGECPGSPGRPATGPARPAPASGAVCVAASVLEGSMRPARTSCRRTRGRALKRLPGQARDAWPSAACGSPCAAPGCAACQGAMGPSPRRAAGRRSHPHRATHSGVSGARSAALSRPQPHRLGRRHSQATGVRAESACHRRRPKRGTSTAV